MSVDPAGRCLQSTGYPALGAFVHVIVAESPITTDVTFGVTCKAIVSTNKIYSGAWNWSLKIAIIFCRLNHSQHWHNRIDPYVISNTKLIIELFRFFYYAQTINIFCENNNIVFGNPSCFSPCFYIHIALFMTRWKLENMNEHELSDWRPAD